MVLFLILYAVVCLWKIRFCKDENYLSVDNTLPVKGVFIIMVFFSHFKSYVSLVSAADQLLIAVVSLFGQAMVAMFLFYSGYGIMESIRKKSQSYIKSMPRKRILATLVRFDIAVLLYLLVCFIIGEKLTCSRVLYSFVAWDSLGNSNWYIFTVLVLYSITYLIFRWVNSEKKALILLSSVVFAVIMLVSRFEIKPLHWYDTAMCYVLGMWYSVYRKTMESFLKNKVVYFVLVSFLSGLWLWMKGRNLFYPAAQQSFSNAVFALLIVFLTMRIRIKNPVLDWCGKYLFELYMLQRIPMILLSAAGLNQSVVLYFMLCGVVTCFMVKPFKKVTDTLLMIVFDK